MRWGFPFDVLFREICGELQPHLLLLLAEDPLLEQRVEVEVVLLFEFGEGV